MIEQDRPKQMHTDSNSINNNFVHSKTVPLDPYRYDGDIYDKDEMHYVKGNNRFYIYFEFKKKKR